MKKSLRITLFATFLLCPYFMRAQTIVSTIPSNKNVLIEEYTGINCVNCPDGHKIANNLIIANPGRVFGVNIHTGGYAPISPPNYHCPDGDAMGSYFQPQSFPIGSLNRIPQLPGGASQVWGPRKVLISREHWASNTTTILNQSSYVNIAAQSEIDYANRRLTVLIEVYYTDDSPVTTNMLTVMLLQNNILGPQTGGAQYNPDQMVNGLYNHQHMLRDIISESGTWGDTIGHTGQGSFFTKTYVYDIPRTINNIPVKLQDLEVFALVSEERINIITACGSTPTKTGMAAHNPQVESARHIPKQSCDHLSNASVTIRNYGTEAIHTLKIEYGVGDNLAVYEFLGDVPFEKDTTVLLPSFYVGAGNTDHLQINLKEQNGTPLVSPNPSLLSIQVGVTKQVGLTTSDSVVIKIWQDRYGKETTWKLFGSDNTLIAEGGPYVNMSINTTYLREHKVKLPLNDCYSFFIYDSGGDGINCGYGEGKYQITELDGTILAFGDGKFTTSDLLMISRYQAGATVEITPQVDNTEEGSVSGGGSVAIGSDAVVTATANTNYQFVNWTIDGVIVSTSPEFSMMAVENATIVANFKNTVAVKPSQLSAVAVFPNPVGDVLTIGYAGKIERYEIYNVSGQLIQRGSHDTKQISVANLADGIYILRIQTKDGVKQQRFIKH